VGRVWTGFSWLTVVNSGGFLNGRNHSEDRRWKDNIKIDVMETELEGVDWIHLAQDRDQWQALMNTVMNLRVLQMAGNFLNS
jgi:hypothetical protein